jgi:hypothetical protein
VKGETVSAEILLDRNGRIPVTINRPCAGTDIKAFAAGEQVALPVNVVSPGSIAAQLVHDRSQHQRRWR